MEFNEFDLLNEEVYASLLTVATSLSDKHVHALKEHTARLKRYQVVEVTDE